MTSADGPYYVCQSGAGDATNVDGIDCQPYNGAPATPGFHPGTWIVCINGDLLSGVFQCPDGITISSTLGSMTIEASGDITQVE